MEGPSRDPRLLAETMSKIERSQFSWCLNNECIHALLFGDRQGECISAVVVWIMLRRGI